jgi:hypothetical protein
MPIAMKTKLLLSVFFTFIFYLLSSQVPQGFNYQAVARDGSGIPLKNVSLQVKISILPDTLTSIAEWEELHASVTTNYYGIFNLVLGTGARQSGSALHFSDVNWSASQLFLKTQIYYQGSWKNMGSAKLWSVPYSLVAGELSGSVSKLAVVGEDNQSDEALFEVKRKDGKTMFAVYNHGVRVYMPLDTLSKTRKGGFAIGGFDETKGTVQDYFVVNPDSIRAYIDTNPVKTRKGGFAIGGFDQTKTGREEYLRVTRDSTRVYLNDTGAKTRKGGFAIGGFGMTKGIQDYVIVSPDSIRMYINDNPGKGAKGGFAIGGFDMTKDGPANFLDVATDASGIINPSQNRILWYPIKNSFLAGRVLIERPDSVGENSMAIGYESKAKGQYSQAMGYKAIVRGDYATAIGKSAVANKINSFAFGENAHANKEESYAFGRGAIAEGFRSFAFGSAGIDSAGQITGVAYAKGAYSFALGMGSQALGDGSFALGIADTAKGGSSLALGQNTSATGWGSTSMGMQTKAYGTFSTTIGFRTLAGNWVDLATGNGTVASGGGSFAGGAFCTASGPNSISYGLYNVASGNVSIALGYKTEASNWVDMAIGDSTSASGGCSFAGGYKCQATTARAFSFGYYNLASGVNALAMGESTKATGDNSFAMGQFSKAIGRNSIAVGNQNLANGHASAALGCSTIASGDFSSSMGYNTRATNYYSFATGINTASKGVASSAFGNGTIANSQHSFVLGMFNDTTNMTSTNGYVLTDPVFVIGNGFSSTNRKNAFTILYNSNVGINMVNPQHKLDIAGGNARIESGYNWLTNSDVRYKKNITTLETSLDKVMKLRGVRFDLVGDTEFSGSYGKNIGFIAQELETVIPEVVVTGADGYKSVAYDKLTAVLTEAIKEQQKQIESVTLENQKLKSDIEALKILVNTLIVSKTNNKDK